MLPSLDMVLVEDGVGHAQKTPDFGALEVESSSEDGSVPAEDTMLSAFSSGQEDGHAGMLHALMLHLAASDDLKTQCL